MTLPSNSLARKQPDSLADVLERVLDKGIVIAGDIVVNVLDIELLSLKLRLFIASAETAREMGMDWWTRDPFFNSQAEQVEAKQPATAQHSVSGSSREVNGSPEIEGDKARDDDSESARLARENQELRAALTELRDREAGTGGRR
ncbi:MAG: gas vesicle protein [Micromonosporaceae bacterium]